jgi:hypothetical protein
MAVKTLIKSFITLALGDKHKNCGNLPQYFNPRISRFKITMVIYTVLFYNIVTWLNVDPNVLHDGNIELVQDADDDTFAAWRKFYETFFQGILKGEVSLYP